MTKRAGRKRRFGPRSPSGHTSGHLQFEQRTIGPPPEIILRRILLVGPSGDPTKASSVVDLLHVHNIIGEDEVRAAKWFCRLFMTRFGYPLPRGTLGDAGMRTSGTAELHETRFDRDAARDYAKAITGIKSKDRGLLIEVIVFNTFPHRDVWRPTRVALSALTRNYFATGADRHRATA